MSVLYSNENGYFISHMEFIHSIYKNVSDSGNKKPFEMVKHLFEIKYPYKKTKLLHKPQKRKLENVDHEAFKCEVKFVQNLYDGFRDDLIKNKIIEVAKCDEGKNTEALFSADFVYNASGNCSVDHSVGENKNEALIVTIGNAKYLFPNNCKFYCSDIHNITNYLENEKYDLILMDPPWWNKYIRRKKMKTSNSYTMMYNSDLKDLPIENLIKDDGIIVVWCTNSVSHLNYLKNEIFKKWNLNYLTKWYWMKVTIYGEPVCNFSDPPGKQPFEQIVFASKNVEKHKGLSGSKLIVSVPSALHSHKPPLQDILQEFIPESAKCLEIFARYLLPNWTSYGLEAIRFQHSSLYEEKQDKT